MSVTFKEAAFGCEKDVTVERSEQCAPRGSGCQPGDAGDLPLTATAATGGAGSGRLWACLPPAVPVRGVGTGRIIHQPCTDCGGQGRVRKRKTIKVNIPAGIDHGQTISAGSECRQNGGSAGDLLITVMVQPDETFRREGVDVFCDAPITFAQAVLGATLEIPTIDGKVKYDLPEGTQTGTVFRLQAVSGAERQRPRRPVCHRERRDAAEPDEGAEGASAELQRYAGREQLRKAQELFKKK